MKATTPSAASNPRSHITHVSVILLALAICTTVFSTTASSSWVAFNDQTRGPGTSLHSTSYSVFTNDWGGEGNAGPLRDIVTSSNLPVTLTITNRLADKGGYSGMPFPGTLADTIFKNYVDFASFGEAEVVRLSSDAAAVGYVFSGLGPARTYTFHGTAVRGGE